MEVILVGESEANLEERNWQSVSHRRGLLGKKKGEIAQIITPSVFIEFEILEISFRYGLQYFLHSFGEIPSYKVAEDDRFIPFLISIPQTRTYTGGSETGNRLYF